MKSAAVLQAMPEQARAEFLTAHMSLRVSSRGASISSFGGNGGLGVKDADL